MDVRNKVAIVTGAGAGIGKALGHALVERGAKVVLADLAPQVDEVAQDLGNDARAVVGDVADGAVIDAAIALADEEFGGVDLYFANAGVIGASGLPEVTEAEWDQSFDVNVRAHVRAAERLVPRWVEDGSGYFVSTASAAGLLTQIGSATYTVTKHAAVAFAEWLSITYGDQGVRVGCLCPMGVETAILRAGERSGNALGEAATKAVLAGGDVLSPQQVADHVMTSVEKETFLILPHPQVLEMMRQRSSDRERWLRGMRRYQASLLA